MMQLSRSSKRLLWLVGLGLGLTIAAAPASALLTVDVKAQGGETVLSATVSEVPLHQFLTAVAVQAGFQLTDLSSSTHLVSVRYQRTPVDQALMQILQREGCSFLLIYQSRGTSNLKHVVVLGVQGAGGESSLSRQALGLTEDATAPDMIVPEDAELLTPETSVEQLLAWTTHRDPRMRTAALEALTLHPMDQRARGKLIDSVHEADPSVRTLAIGLLGPFLTQWSGAEDAVMTALSDVDPSVRQLALITIEEQSSARMAEALDIAARDSTSEIRMQAEELRQRTSATSPTATP